MREDGEGDTVETPMQSDAIESPHPDAAAVAGYLDRTLAPDEYARVEAHFATCAQCQRDVLAVTRVLVRAHPRRGRRVWVLSGSVAAGLMAAGLVLWFPLGLRPDAGRTRGNGIPGGEGVPALVATAPTEDGAVASDALVFRWSPAGDPEALYELVISDSIGNIVLRRETREAVVDLESPTGLAPGSRYYWYVDALLSDGRSATTGVRTFRLVP